MSQDISGITRSPFPLAPGYCKTCHRNLSCISFSVLAPVLDTDVTIELLPVCTATNEDHWEVHIMPPIMNFRIVS